MTIKVTITVDPSHDQKAWAQYEERTLDMDTHKGVWLKAKRGPVLLDTNQTELWVHSGQRIVVYESPNGV
jgi:hypothetical protein